jgi:hypothetical protein
MDAMVLAGFCHEFCEIPKIELSEKHILNEKWFHLFVRLQSEETAFRPLVARSVHPG